MSRRRMPQQPQAVIEEPPKTFRYRDWADPDDPSLEFLDDAHIRAVRRWSDARLAWHQAKRRRA